MSDMCSSWGRVLCGRGVPRALLNAAYFWTTPVVLVAVLLSKGRRCQVQSMACATVMKCVVWLACAGAKRSAAGPVDSEQQPHGLSMIRNTGGMLYRLL
jgi:hypothetical protein